MSTFLWIAGGVAGALVLLTTGLLIVARIGMPSAEEMNLGVSGGRLVPCPNSPNCVSTMADDDAHSVDPISFAGTADQAFAAATEAISTLDRVRIINQKPGYLWAEIRSFTFRFIDDVEVYIPEGVREVHFRSASRAGFGDMGVNRRRYEAFRSAFLAAME